MGFDSSNEENKSILLAGVDLTVTVWAIHAIYLLGILLCYEFKLCKAVVLQIY